MDTLPLFLGQNCTRLMEWGLSWSCRSYLVRLEFRSLPVSRGTGAAWFFSRPKRPRRPQHVTYEQRQIAADRPNEITRGDRSRTARRNSNIPDANREPHVFRVAQDLMRLVHSMLPLERICQTSDERDKNKCWDHSKEGAYNFATADRVGQLTCLDTLTLNGFIQAKLATIANMVWKQKRL